MENKNLLPSQMRLLGQSDIRHNSLLHPSSEFISSVSSFPTRGMMLLKWIQFDVYHIIFPTGSKLSIPDAYKAAHEFWARYEFF